MFRKKWFWIVLVLVIAAGGAAAAFARRGDPGTTVTVETIQKRDLEAIVSASGKIDPKKTVNISAQTMGRVTQTASEAASRLSDKAHELYDLQGEYVETARSYVREHPMAAIGIAIAVGLLISRLTSRR